MKKQISLNTKFELSNEAYINPQFTKGRCRIAYSGNNRNYSNITKEAFEKAMPSLMNIPVVGYYDEETGEFTGHIGKIEMTNGEFKIHYPIPVGVVPENCNPTFDKVVEEDGSVNEYLSCDVLLWTGRWQHILDAYEKGNGFRQSMEIEVNSWSSIDEEYMKIDDFVYSSLTILQNGQTPCFESSNIELFNLNKDKFKQEFSLLLNEIKNTKSNFKENKKGEGAVKVKGDLNKNKKKENKVFELSVSEKYEKIQAILEEHHNIQDSSAWVWITELYDTYLIYEYDEKGVERVYFKVNYSLDNEEIKVDFENQVKVKRTWGEIEETEEYKLLKNKYSEIKKKVETLKNEKKNFQLSHEDKEDRLRIAVANEFNVDKWDVWVGSSNVYDTYFIYEMWKEDVGYKFYKANYSVDAEENAVVDFNDVQEVLPKQIWVTVNEYTALESKYNKAQETINSFEKEKEEFETKIGKYSVKVTELEKTNKELTSFKKNIEEKQRTDEVNSVISQFSSLSDVEKVELKEKAIKGEITTKELEDKLFALVGRKNFSVETKIDKTIGFNLNLNAKSDDDKCPYAGLEDLFYNK